MFIETALTFLQINQVAKHPAILCHDVCVIGWFKKRSYDQVSEISSNLNYKSNYKIAAQYFII